jgi:monothiol glutaredoxin
VDGSPLHNNKGQTTILYCFTLKAAFRPKGKMTRSILDEAHIHPTIRETIADNHADLVREVQAAVAANDVVVVSMKQNPVPKQARKALDAAGIAYKYLEYGSYFGPWRRRNALKMWIGWPTSSRRRYGAAGRAQSGCVEACRIDHVFMIRAMVEARPQT